MNTGASRSRNGWRALTPASLAPGIDASGLLTGCNPVAAENRGRTSSENQGSRDRPGCASHASRRHALLQIPERHSSLLHPQRWRDWPVASRALSSRWQWLRLPVRSESSLHPRSGILHKPQCRRALDIPLRLRPVRSARRCSRKPVSAPGKPALPQRKPRTLQISASYSGFMVRYGLSHLQTRPAA